MYCFLSYLVYRKACANGARSAQGLRPRPQSLTLTNRHLLVGEWAVDVGGVPVRLHQ
jgi:hypothetical protein